MIRGINHVTFAVRSLETSLAFYGEVLGMRLLARWPLGAYFEAGGLWVALSVDDATRRGPLPEYTHVAFTVAQAEFASMSARIRASGATIWKENRSEGASLYFLDPDGHKLEIHTTDLEARLSAARDAPWPGLELFDRDTLVDFEA